MEKSESEVHQKLSVISLDDDQIEELRDEEQYVHFKELGFQK